MAQNVLRHNVVIVGKFFKGSGVSEDGEKPTLKRWKNTTDLPRECLQSKREEGS